MTKAYLLVFGPQLGTNDEVKAILDSIPQIVNWRFDMPNAFYLISYESAASICNRIKSMSGKKHPVFLVDEITKNKQGWLVKKTWNFINQNPS